MLTVINLNPSRWGSGFSFIYYREKLLDAVSFGSFLSFSYFSSVTVQVSLSWRQALSHEAAVLLPPYIQVHTGCRWQTLVLCLCVSSPSARTPSFRDCLCPHVHLPKSLRWLLLQSGYALCRLRVIISPPKKQLLPPSFLNLTAVILYVWFCYSTNCFHWIQYIKHGAVELWTNNNHIVLSAISYVQA